MARNTAHAPEQIVVKLRQAEVQTGLTRGLLLTIVANTGLADLRGTAFGVSKLVGGVARLRVGILASALWAMLGPGAALLAGVVMAATWLVGFNGLQGGFRIARIGYQ